MCRTELLAAGKPAADDDVVACFCDSVAQDGFMRRYMNAGQLVVVIDSNIFVHGGLFNHDGDASERCITAVLSSALPSSHRPFEQVLLSLTFTLSAFQVSGSNFDFFTKSHDHICIFFQSAFVYSINLFCAPSLRLTLFMLCRDVLVGPSDAHMFEWLTGFQFPISVCDFSLQFQFAISVCDFSLRFQFAISVSCSRPHFCFVQL
jgi:hypothetical protein